VKATAARLRGHRTDCLCLGCNRPFFAIKQPGAVRGLGSCGPARHAELAENCGDVVGDVRSERCSAAAISVFVAPPASTSRTSCSRRVRPAALARVERRGPRSEAPPRASRSRAKARLLASAPSRRRLAMASRAARSSPGRAASAASYGAPSVCHARTAPRQSPASSSRTGSGSGGASTSAAIGSPQRAAHSRASPAGRTSWNANGAARPSRARA
jgi:hypothetical protein